MEGRHVEQVRPDRGPQRGARRETRPKSITIDMPRAWRSAAQRVRAPHSMSTIRSAFRHAETQQRCQAAARFRGASAPTGLRFKTMDDMGVDMQLISPGPPQLYYTIPLEPAVQSTRALNDGIAEYAGKHPDRLVALGGVPMMDAGEAVKELERCMTQLKFKGVEILTNVAGKELSDPAYAPFWKRAEELGALVMIHPNGLHAGRSPRALLLQQRDRQSARYHHRAALPDFRRRAGAPSEPEDLRRPRRRISRRLLGPDRPRLGRTLGFAWSSAEAADHLPAEDLLPTRWCSRRTSSKPW
jgi:predicted TIM-barrel fold metal-dependent hydrolase